MTLRLPPKRDNDGDASADYERSSRHQDVDAVCAFEEAKGFFEQMENGQLKRAREKSLLWRRKRSLSQSLYVERRWTRCQQARCFCRNNPNLLVCRPKLSIE